MKYAVWFVRLTFAAWMIPAGLNHFIPLFPQPMGSQPLSQELIVALIDSHLFDLVKAVELIAGLGVLFGYYTPLALLVCLPVSFGVFYWDAPLEGWGSRAALFGYATFLSNLLLCLAYYKNYLSMFTLRTNAQYKQQAVMAARLLFGAWMFINGANYLFLSLWAAPMGQDPLAMQLMTALVNSRLLDVVMVIQLLAGALLLVGFLVPLALYLLMPISSCALFWALILDQQPLGALLAILAFALNGLLMLAYLPYYRGVLERRPLAIGESPERGRYFESLFVNPKGHTLRARFVAPLVTVLAVIAFFAYMVGGRTAQFCMLVLLYPAFVLLARRLRDMGYSAWLLLIPVLPALAAFAVQLGYFSLGETLDRALPWAALLISAAFAIWGAVSDGKQSPGQGSPAVSGGSV